MSKYGWYSQKMRDSINESNQFSDDPWSPAVTESKTESGLGWDDAVCVGPVIRQIRSLDI